MKVSYPLSCGCTSPNYHGLCTRHQAEDQRAAQLRAGVPDVILAVDPMTAVGRERMLAQLAQACVEAPGTTLLVKLILESK